MQKPWVRPLGCSSSAEAHAAMRSGWPLALERSPRLGVVACKRQASGEGEKVSHVRVTSAWAAALSCGRKEGTTVLPCSPPTRLYMVFLPIYIPVCMYVTSALGHTPEWGRSTLLTLSGMSDYTTY